MVGGRLAVPGKLKTIPELFPDRSSCRVERKSATKLEHVLFDSHKSKKKTARSYAKLIFVSFSFFYIISVTNYIKVGLLRQPRRYNTRLLWLICHMKYHFTLGVEVDNFIS